jgi:3-oxoacyl-[acyl-carrier protein] reductase
MEFRFDNKVALVTGASSGIGRAIALEFGRCGGNVVVNYFKNGDAAQEVVKEIEYQGHRAIAIQGDVSKKNDVECLVKNSLQKFNRIDILVNNAGDLIERVGFMEISERLWDRAMDVNLKSVFLCSRAVVPIMERQGGGRIINICSGSIHTGGGQGAVHYAAAKGGVRTLTRGMAKELVGKRILVNGINPGIVTTPLQDRYSTPEIRDAFRKRIPLGREASPEEIAAAAIFLASDQASYFVGEMIEINGGMIMA